MKTINDKFYPAIDGLRAFSFLIVFFFHAGVPGMKFGWGGVTIFFAISGFLITGILLRNKSKNAYFKSFFIRRSLRIFPLYYLTVLTLFTGVWLRFPEVSGALIYLVTYTQNYFYYEMTSFPYMDLLAHTWTLAIEEQFYIIWPFFIYFINAKYLKFLFPTIIIFSVVFRTFGIELFKYNYINLLSQLDSLVIGAMLALLLFNQISIKRLKLIMKFSLLMGIIGIFTTLIYLSRIYSLALGTTFMEIGGKVDYLHNKLGVNLFFFISLIALGLIILCITENNYVYRIFNNSVLKHLGKISYGMYLFHYPILIILRTYVSQNVFILCVLGFLITYLISILSFKTIELYFNRLKTKFTY